MLLHCTIWYLHVCVDFLVCTVTVILTNHAASACNVSLNCDWRVACIYIDIAVPHSFIPHTQSLTYSPALEY